MTTEQKSIESYFEAFADNQKTPVDMALALLDKQNIPLTTNTRNVAVSNLVVMVADYAKQKGAMKIQHVWNTFYAANQLHEISHKGWRATDFKEMFNSVLVTDGKMATTEKNRLLAARE